MPRLETGFARVPGKAVPGAYQLTVITAVDAVADQWSQVFGDGTAQLDGQVGNAQACIEPVGRHDGAGRAGIDAGMTVTAVSLCRGIGRQCQVGVQLAEKKPGSGLLVDQVGVFADPAEPGLLCQCLFQYRCTVGKGAIAELADVRGDPVRQLLQSPAQQLVVVATEGIAGQVGKRGLLQHRICLACRPRPVVHADGNHTGGARYQVGRAAAPCAVARHVIHVAVVARLQPAEEMRFVFIELNGADSDLLETQCTPPAPDVGNQRVGIAGGPGTAHELDLQVCFTVCCRNE